MPIMITTCNILYSFFFFVQLLWGQKNVKFGWRFGGWWEKKFVFWKFTNALQEQRMSLLRIRYIAFSSLKRSTLMLSLWKNSTHRQSIHAVGRYSFYTFFADIWVDTFPRLSQNQWSLVIFPSHSYSPAESHYLQTSTERTGCIKIHRSYN